MVLFWSLLNKTNLKKQKVIIYFVIWYLKKMCGSFPVYKNKTKTNHPLHGFFFFFPNGLSFFPQLYGIALIWTLTLAYVSLIESQLLWVLNFLLQDPIESLRQKCAETEHCIHTWERLEQCETRVGSRSSTEEDCTEELFDFLHARDHCVSVPLGSCTRQKD